MEIPSGIFTQVKKTNSCSTGWDIFEDRKLGAGFFGTVYNTCCADNCEYIAKVQINDGYNNRELVLQNRAAKLNITIPIIDNWEYKEYSIFIMKSLHITLNKFIQNLLFSDDINDEDKFSILSRTLCKINDKIYTLIYELGIDHRDIKGDNIMLNKAGEPFLIDFGVSAELHPNNYYDQLKLEISQVLRVAEDYLDNESYLFLIKKIKSCSNQKEVISILKELLN